MSRRCDICGRAPLSSATRSHSMQKTKRKQFLNLQTKTINGKKTKICTRCLRTLIKKGKI